MGRSPGVGNGNPFQYSCLGNPIDRGISRATVHRVTQSWTRLGRHTHRHERREVKQEGGGRKEREAEGWKRSWRRKGGALMTGALLADSLFLLCPVRNLGVSSAVLWRPHLTGGVSAPAVSLIWDPGRSHMAMCAHVCVCATALWMHILECLPRCLHSLSNSPFILVPSP